MPRKRSFGGIARVTRKGWSLALASTRNQIVVSVVVSAMAVLGMNAYSQVQEKSQPAPNLAAELDLERAQAAMAAYERAEVHGTPDERCARARGVVAAYEKVGNELDVAAWEERRRSECGERIEELAD